MKKSRIIFISVMTALVISGIFFSVYFKNKIKNIKNLRASIENLYAAGMPAEEAPKESTGLNQLFPPKGGTTEFIENIFILSKKYFIKDMHIEYKSHEAIESGTGKQMSSGHESGQKKNVIYAHPIRINFNSGYRNMAEFIREIQNRERLVSVKSLKATKGKYLLSVELVLNIYSMEEK
jgi:Tfp pilus assembly protein PilO